MLKISDQDLIVRKPDKYELRAGIEPATSSMTCYTSKLPYCRDPVKPNKSQISKNEILMPHYAEFYALSDALSIVSQFHKPNELQA